MPLEIIPLGEQYLIRGVYHIMTFDPRVMLVQWSAIFSATETSDNTVLRTGKLPPYSAVDRSYFLTQLAVGSGRRSREVMSILGVDRNTGEITARHDFPEVRDLRVLIDHSRDRLFVMGRGEKRTVDVSAWSL